MAMNKPRQITIGWMRDDGDLDVFMAVHLANLTEREAAPDFFGNQDPLDYYQDLAKNLGCVILERDDMPDTLELS